MSFRQDQVSGPCWQEVKTSCGLCVLKSPSSCPGPPWPSTLWPALHVHLPLNSTLATFPESDANLGSDNKDLERSPRSPPSDSHSVLSLVDVPATVCPLCPEGSRSQDASPEGAAWPWPGVQAPPQESQVSFLRTDAPFSPSLGPNHTGVGEDDEGEGMGTRRPLENQSSLGL